MRRALFALLVAIAAVVVVSPVGAELAPPQILSSIPSFLPSFTQISGTGGNVALKNPNNQTLQVRTGDDAGYAALAAARFDATVGFTFNFNALWSAVAPTISSGFGTSPSVVSNAGSATFRINVGTGGVATSGVLGMPTAATGWNCAVTDTTNNIVTRETANTTTTVTVTAASAWTASDVLIFICAGY